MAEYDCPAPAYKRLVSSGIVNRILEKRKRDEIGKIMLYGPEDAREIFAKARDKLEPIEVSERAEIFKEILDLESAVDDRNCFASEKNKMFMKFPALLAYVAVGEDLTRFEEFGFPSRQSLERAITSFCIGENLWNGSDRDYSWRNGKMKNSINHDVHGDVYIGQINLAGRERKFPTLFEEQKGFELLGLELDDYKDCAGLHEGIGADYNYWETFLISALKWAEAIGKKNIPEITDWKRALASIGGGVGTHTSECEFGGSGSDDWRFDMEVKETPILIQGRESEVKLFPHCIKRGYGDDLVYPYVIGNELHFICKSAEGNIEIPSRAEMFNGVKFKSGVVYQESDLPEVLKGTYKYFARDRSAIPKIIDKFLRG